MANGNSALGQSLVEAHEASIEAAAQHCHFRRHAEQAIDAYLANMYAELEKRGFLLSIVKIQDEQDN